LWNTNGGTLSEFLTSMQLHFSSCTIFHHSKEMAATVIKKKNFSNTTRISQAATMGSGRIWKRNWQRLPWEAILHLRARRRRQSSSLAICLARNSWGGTLTLFSGKWV